MCLRKLKECDCNCWMCPLKFKSYKDWGSWLRRSPSLRRHLYKHESEIVRKSILVIYQEMFNPLPLIWRDPAGFLEVLEDMFYYLSIISSRSSRNWHTEIPKNHDEPCILLINKKYVRWSSNWRKRKHQIPTLIKTIKNVQNICQNSASIIKATCILRHLTAWSFCWNLVDWNVWDRIWAWSWNGSWSWDS